jgi:hypothetical protein
LGALQKQFSSYFEKTPISEDFNGLEPICHYQLLRNNNFSRKQLTDISCDGSLNDMVHADELPQVCPLVKSLSYKAVNAFVTTYLCETGFRTIDVMKAEYRSRLVIEKELRAAISLMTPRFGKLCAEMQAHLSH